MTAQGVDESLIYACGIEMMGNLVGDEQVATDSTIGTEAEDFTSKIERLVKMESNHISPEHKPRRENLDRVVRGTDPVIRSRHLRT